MLKLTMSDAGRQPVHINPASIVALEGRTEQRIGKPCTRVYLVGGHWLDVDMAVDVLAAKIDNLPPTAAQGQ